MRLHFDFVSSSLFLVSSLPRIHVPRRMHRTRIRGCFGVWAIMNSDTCLYPREYRFVYGTCTHTHTYNHVNRADALHLYGMRLYRPKRKCIEILMHFTHNSSFEWWAALDCIRALLGCVLTRHKSGVNLFRSASLRLRRIRSDAEWREEKKKWGPRNWYWSGMTRQQKNHDCDRKCLAAHLRNAIDSKCARSRIRIFIRIDRITKYNKRYTTHEYIYLLFNIHERKPSHSMNIHYTLCFVYSPPLCTRKHGDDEDDDNEY